MASSSLSDDELSEHLSRSSTPKPYPVGPNRPAPAWSVLRNESLFAMSAREAAVYFARNFLESTENNARFSQASFRAGALRGLLKTAWQGRGVNLGEREIDMLVSSQLSSLTISHVEHDKDPPKTADEFFDMQPPNRPTSGMIYYSLNVTLQDGALLDAFMGAYTGTGHLSSSDIQVPVSEGDEISDLLCTQAIFYDTRTFLEQIPQKLPREWWRDAFQHDSPHRARVETDLRRIQHPWVAVLEMVPNKNHDESPLRRVSPITLIVLVCFVVDVTRHNTDTAIPHGLELSLMRSTISNKWFQIYLHAKLSATPSQSFLGGPLRDLLSHFPQFGRCTMSQINEMLSKCQVERYQEVKPHSKESRWGLLDQICVQIPQNVLEVLSSKFERGTQLEVAASRRGQEEEENLVDEWHKTGATRRVYSKEYRYSQHDKYPGDMNRIWHDEVDPDNKAIFWKLEMHWAIPLQGSRVPGVVRKAVVLFVPLLHVGTE